VEAEKHSENLFASSRTSSAIFALLRNRLRHIEGVEIDIRKDPQAVGEIKLARHLG
jgi:hypothetical protein